VAQIERRFKAHEGRSCCSCGEATVSTRGVAIIGGKVAPSFSQPTEVRSCPCRPGRPRLAWTGSGALPQHLQPSSRQGELIALARRLACARFAPRADRHDCAASFPFDDYADLRAEGLLGLCVPERYGGRGADYETYCLVAEQLAQGNASTRSPSTCTASPC
jgi:hypothetical protein